MATEMKRFAKRYTTTDVKDAATRNGKALIVPRSVPELLGTEGANTSKLMRVLYHNPTTVWKTLLLGYSPRYFVNNAVGNLLMYGSRRAAPTRWLRRSTPCGMSEARGSLSTRCETR
jgi:hypothetical protein